MRCQGIFTAMILVTPILLPFLTPFTPLSNPFGKGVAKDEKGKIICFAKSNTKTILLFL